MSSHTTFFTGQSAFERLQQESNQLILVKFVAPHCSACVTLSPVIEALVKERAGKLHLVEIDMTEAPELAINTGIRSAPTIAFFKGQKLLTRIAGLRPKKEYAQTIDQYL